MKAKEIKQVEALERQNVSTFVAPEKPCVACRFYESARCRRHDKWTARKATCDDWVRQ
jgi:hypothetical protein